MNVEDGSQDAEYSLIHDLCESRMFSSKGKIKKYNAKQIADLLFLNIIALHILRSEFDYLDIASKYATATLRWQGFDTFRFQATDLYVLAYQILSGDSKNLKKTDANELFLKNLSFDEPQFRRWLRRIMHNQEDRSQDRRFILAAQEGLQISDSSYRAMRRLCVHWGDDATESEKRLVLTRLLMALRARAPRSELLPYLEKLAKKDRLELKGGNVCNPETGKGCEPEGPGLMAKAVAAAAGFMAGRALVNHMRGKKE